MIRRRRERFVERASARVHRRQPRGAPGVYDGSATVTRDQPRDYAARHATTGRQPAMSDDLDLHGRVGIRLIDAGPADRAAVVRQLGPLGDGLARPPDITIRFVDRLPDDGPLRYIGHEDAGFTDGRYLVLRGRHQARVRVAIPMESLGGALEIVCERGAPAVPLLVAIVNLTALARGLLPMHACAFRHQGLGVLIVGWAKGGKSETLLAFTARGAELVGDEWIYLDGATRRLAGLPEPMRVWDWQLRAMPELQDRVPAGARRRLALTRAGVAGLRGVARLPVIGRAGPGRLATRLRPLLENQLSVQLPPERLLDSPVVRGGADLDRIVLVLSHEPDEIVVTAADPLDLARRATTSFMFEMADILGHYQRFRYAFPDRANPWLDGLETRYAEAIADGFRGVPALTAAHPYPLAIPRLYDAIEPHLR